jgi:uncharacterized protein
LQCQDPSFRDRRSARMISSGEDDRPEESASHPERVFLSAEWRNLVMLNYEVDPALLNDHVPSGTTLDSFRGKTYVSLVGFRFCRSKLFGYFSVPFHSNFDEVNLRFYVRRQKDGEVRRGVVFIAEVVPRRAIAITARLVYGENYKYAPMRHGIESVGANKRIEFQFQIQDQWCRLSAEAAGIPAVPQAGTLEQFITEHYWGYSAQSFGKSIEYHVSHVPWKVWSTSSSGFGGDASFLYGPELAKILQQHPDSAFVAEGSPVAVFKGSKII